MISAEIGILPVLAIGAAAIAGVLIFLIRALASVRLEELRILTKGGLTDAQLDEIAARLAERLARREADRGLLLELAKMSEEEFRVYKDALRVERDAIRERPEPRPRDRERA